MTHLHITAAAPGDQEWCARLMTSIDPWVTLGRELEACRETLVRPGAELFVARDHNEDRLLGFILLAPNGLAGSPYVNSIAVASGAQGQGVGSELLRFAERHFSGRKHIFLLVSSFNQRAQEFYRRHGYELIGEIKAYIVAGHSELIFHKRLVS